MSCLLRPAIVMFLNSMLAPPRLKSTLSRLRGSRGGRLAEGIPVFMKPFSDWTTLNEITRDTLRLKIVSTHILRHATISSLLSRQLFRSLTRSPLVRKIQLRKISVFLTSMLLS